MKSIKQIIFKKNQNLEDIISNLNNLLKGIDNSVLNFPQATKRPLIFIVGTPRSGTTLLTQWLASLNLFSYPSNFMSRFFELPYAGALIQDMIFDERYSFKNEMSLKIDLPNFGSDVGKTLGPLQPHEFWYFWRKHFKFPEIPVTSESFMKTADFKSFQSQISLVTHIMKSLSL